MQGMAKICDFGWAIYEPQGLRTTICGTPLYLAPEMLRGKGYDSKIDLWALGTLTHELLTN
jgi:serine/threonine-protein kinase ULK/ATG1